MEAKYKDKGFMAGDGRRTYGALFHVNNTRDGNTSDVDISVGLNNISEDLLSHIVSFIKKGCVKATLSATCKGAYQSM